MEKSILMKILIVNFSDIYGGAARAAYRLHQSLLTEGLDSKMLVQDKNIDDYTVITETNKFLKIINKVRKNIDQIKVKKYKNRTKTFFSTSWFGVNNIIDKINEINPDIVHLHWINKGMIKIEELSKINAPIVWSLHDMWAFTGGCHYDEECKLYEKNCGNCKVLRSVSENDLSRKIYNRKKKTYSKIDNMTFVGLSRWMNESAKCSNLLKDKRHINLVNPINTKIFKPFDKNMARELWSLTLDKKLVLFGAIGATSDPRKGFLELSEALKKIKDSDIELVVFGSGKPKEPDNLGFKVHYLGSISDDISLVTLYNAVDVMIVPSLQENLSNTIMESLACATPVVGFNIGGNSDMIEHRKNGYLAKPYDATDLAFGIEWIINNKNYDKMCEYGREKVLREFDSKIVANKYIELYESILNRQSLNE